MKAQMQAIRSVKVHNQLPAHTMKAVSWCSCVSWTVINDTIDCSLSSDLSFPTLEIPKFSVSSREYYTVHAYYLKYRVSTFALGMSIFLCIQFRSRLYCTFSPFFFPAWFMSTATASIALFIARYIDADHATEDKLSTFCKGNQRQQIANYREGI